MRDRHVERLMDKLFQAIEVSLKATEASREAVQEILKRGADTAIFFAGAAADPKAPRGEEIQLTPQDREFLRTLSIRPDSA